MNIHSSSPGTEASADVKVWDPLVRIFHWSLVATFTTAFLTGEEVEDVVKNGSVEEGFRMELHENAGYVVLGLVVFRIIWGLIGGKSARFGDFIYPPSMVFGYLFDLLRFKAKRYLGHSPAGGAMVLALLIALPIVAGTGVLLTLDAFKGSIGLGEVHAAAANITLGLILVHIAGVVIASIEHKENLVRAMIHGRKRGETPPSA
jgi:cytochrome b